MVTNTYDLNDSCTKKGAEALKKKIEAYWEARGHLVVVALHDVGFHAAVRSARCDVRSDMVNGLPRSALVKKHHAPRAVRLVHTA